MVCDNCLTILEQIGDGVVTGKIDYSPSYIERGSEEGCIICMSIKMDHVTANHPELKFWVNPQNDRDPPLAHGNRYLAFLLIVSGSPDYIVSHVELLRDNFDGRPYKPPVSTGDHEALSIASSWLQECVSSHTQCKFQAELGFVPPRLLDLRNGKVSLVSMIGDTSPPQYVTLSHCWGPNPDNLKLCSHNKRDFEDVVPMDALPKTFMDAVHASRQLGLDFLWIDSLCIVQEGPGSKEDWLQHVKIMKLIYQNAALNLSADVSENANQGLFRHRNQRRILTPRVRVKGSALEGKYVVYTGLETRQDPPLSRRGWVLQERLFSPRILHFGSEQLEWECNDSSDISERYPYKLNERPIRPGMYSDDTFRMMKTDSSNPQADFMRLVSEYTKCQLTYPALDKLAAFSAISEHFSSRLGQRYQAGFLQKSLPYSLVWQLARQEDGTKPRQPSSLTTFRAPSWSWASVDDQIFFPNRYDIDKIAEGARGYSPISHIQSLLVNPLDPSNPFGRLKEAKITLVAPLSTCQWEIYGDSRSCTSLIVRDFITPGENYWLNTDVEFDHVEDTALPFDQVNVVAIYSRRPRWDDDEFSLYILLLHRTFSAEYRRIGTGHLRWLFTQEHEARFHNLEKREIVIV